MNVNQWLRPFLQCVLGFLFRLRYKIIVHNQAAIPQDGSLLLLGNHISWIDWALIQLAVIRPIRFVIDRRFYDMKLLHGFLKRFGTVPISPSKSKQSIKDIHHALLGQNVICLFPEGEISQDGEICKIKRGFEFSLKNSHAPVVPFYIFGMAGSLFARAKADERHRWLKRRRVHIWLHEPLDDSVTAIELATILKALESEAKSSSISI